MLHMFYSNFFTAGALIPTFLCLYLAYFFLVSIPGRSKPTLHLGIFFGYMFLFNFAYVIAGGFYHPLAAYHRWLTVGVILVGQAHMNMFFCCLGEEKHAKFGNYLLTVLIAIALTVIAVFYFKTFGGDTTFHFDGHYWDFNADAISKIVGILIFLNILIAIGLVLWMVFIVKPRGRWFVLGIGVMYLGATLVPSVANILSRAGKLDRGTFQITWDLFSIFGFFLLAILYINYTKDRTTFMAKIAGISLVTILVVMQVMSYYSFRDQENAYDDTRRAAARLAIATGERSSDMEYIVRYRPGKQNEVIFQQEGMGAPALPDALLRLAPPAAQGERVYRTLQGRDFVSYLFRERKSGLDHEVGYSYLKYREVQHASTKNFIIMLIGVLVAVLVGFRYFFLGTLFAPLRRLMEGLSQVQKGDLDTRVEPAVEDEIGLLTHSFNQMVFTIKKAKKQLDDYAESLEAMVEERTAALREASDALWGEMQLAKKIQTVLLPEEPRMMHYRILGYMHPAEEVGGDYYDIINGKDMDWVFIGDVSGHGVSAGIVMMMAQTSLRSILRGNSNLNPSLLLKVANKTISYNVTKMNENKYMTITAFAFHRDGKVTYSGLHQDIMVYRAAGKRVEVIETDGLWLGLSVDLMRNTVDFEFHINVDDVVLLYTDGVTEAKGINGELFGNKRLAEVFESLGERSLESIRDGINAALENYQKNDDVTMVILKCVE